MTSCFHKFVTDTEPSFNNEADSKSQLNIKLTRIFSCLDIVEILPYFAATKCLMLTLSGRLYWICYRLILFSELYINVCCFI